jgi:uncharacterized protein
MIQFTFQDDEASRDAARAQALQPARQRAGRYAEAADMRVSAIRSIIDRAAHCRPAADAMGML